MQHKRLHHRPYCQQSTPARVAWSRTLRTEQCWLGPRARAVQQHPSAMQFLQSWHRPDSMALSTLGCTLQKVLLYLPHSAGCTFHLAHPGSELLAGHSLGERRRQLLSGDPLRQLLLQCVYLLPLGPDQLQHCSEGVAQNWLDVAPFMGSLTRGDRMRSEKHCTRSQHGNTCSRVPEAMLNYLCQVLQH